MVHPVSTKTNDQQKVRGGDEKERSAYDS